ncbi:hypothetical protein [Streptomyces sp. H27-D2]|uniref:hypothetical protein n=1 Tax=Streptomyces sp. H27-D2 TaxID=3046304 RepID=UPI002DBAB433|nr:hypothetical protein [Streptomyces sp. H27-D2]MEC4019996.1 hypothetical protein [Streptomyces sp. H27-D2]
MTLRSPTGEWLRLGKDGRLSAYVQEAEGVVRWTETRPGGPHWTGPDPVPAPGLRHVTVAQGPDGYVHLLGLRRNPLADGEVEADIVHATQYQPGRPFTAWHSLGNPHAKSGDEARALSRPAAAVAGPGGAVHVFVRNAGHGVHLRRQGADGKWQPWTDLGGRRVLDELTAVATAAGRVELLARTHDGAARWHQEDPSGDFIPCEDVAAHPAVGAVGALETGEDRLTYFWHEGDGDGIVAHRPGTDPVRLGGSPTAGPAAALRAPIDGHDCTVLAHRGKNGRPMLAAWPTEDESAGVWWTETGEECVGPPALALDAAGRVVLAAVGLDGGLRVARQKTTEPGLALAAWSRV